MQLQELNAVHYTHLVVSNFRLQPLYGSTLTDLSGSVMLERSVNKEGG